MITERRRVAQSARALLGGELGWDEFLEDMPEEPRDPDIAELLDLVVHEPAIGGLFGVGRREHEAYVAQVVAVIERLEAS